MELKIHKEGIYEHYWLLALSTLCSLSLALLSIICLKTGGRLFLYTTSLGYFFMFAGIETEMISTGMGNDAGVGAEVVSYGGISLTVLLLLGTICGIIILLSKKRTGGSFLRGLLFFVNEMCVSLFYDSNSVVAMLKAPSFLKDYTLVAWMIVISWVMGCTTLVFALISFIDVKSYKNAMKRIKRDERKINNGGTSTIRLIPDPGSKTKTLRLVLCLCTVVPLIISYIIVVVLRATNNIEPELTRDSFKEFIIFQVAILSLSLICFFAVILVKRRGDWFVSFGLIISSWMSAILYAWASQNVIGVIDENSGLLDFGYGLLCVPLLTSLIYLIVEYYTRKWEYLNVYAHETVLGETT